MSTQTVVDQPATAPATPPVVIERKHLMQALAQVMPATAGRGTSLPVLSGVRFEKDGERLRVTGTDLDISVTTTIPAEIPGDFDVVVQAKLLQRLVKESAGPLTFTFADGDLTLTWGRTVAVLKTYPADEFPKTRVVTGPKIVLSASDVGLVRRIANFCSNDDARPILTGLRFGGKPHGVVGTDSYRLGIANIDAELPEQPFLLQARVARFLPTAMLDTEVATITLEESPGARARYAQIDVGEISIQSVLVDGEFPPFERLIPEVAASKITFSLPELFQAVRAAGILLADATPVRIALDLDAKTASIVGVQQDVGQLQTTLDILSVEGGAPPLTCAFNPGYLKEFLAMLSADTVTLELVDMLKPMVVTEDRLKLLIMPVRVS